MCAAYCMYISYYYTCTCIGAVSLWSGRQWTGSLPLPTILKYTHTQRLRADLEDREAQLRAKEEEMNQGDADISRLMGELRRCQAQLLRHQV